MFIQEFTQIGARSGYEYCYGGGYPPLVQRVKVEVGIVFKYVSSKYIYILKINGF